MGEENSHVTEPYNSLEEFRELCMNFAKEHDFKVGKNWKQLTSILCINHYHCTSQEDHPVCPCPNAIEAIKEKGCCSCELYYLRKDS